MREPLYVRCKAIILHLGKIYYPNGELALIAWILGTSLELAGRSSNNLMTMLSQ